MGQKIVLKVGEVFGKLTIVREVEKDDCGNIMYFCDCECGGSRIARGSSIKPGFIKSCGCLAKPRVKVKCDCCGREKLEKYKRAKRLQNHFCNRECMGKWNTKKNNPHWQEGGVVKRNCGYKWIKSNGEWEKEHVVISEKILGRKLSSDEVVHHINYIKSDNRNSNLLICTKKYHSKIHNNMARKYAEKFFQ